MPLVWHSDIRNLTELYLVAVKRDVSLRKINVERGRNYHFYLQTVHPRGDVTYRFGVVFGSLRMQQLHGFDELLNDQGVIQNCGAKIDTTAASLHWSASYFKFRFLRLAKIIERMGNGTKRALGMFG
jgi:hypothetical protein